MNGLKRGSWARDRRTGQIVKVAETRMGDDYLVRPGYRSDGFWVPWVYLDPAPDPHAWTRRDRLKAAGVCLLSLWAAASVVWDVLRGDVGPVSAVVYGCCAAHVVGTVLAEWTGLKRP